jgi:rubrerythrin
VGSLNRENTSKKRVLAYLRIAMRLEEEAIERYTGHIEKIENPDINTLLEGIRRNEERHLQTINDNIKLFEK